MIKIFKKQILELIQDLVGSDSKVEVHFVTDIPYSLSGKVKVKQLQEMLG